MGLHGRLTVPLSIPTGTANASLVFQTSTGDGPFVTTCGVTTIGYEDDFVSLANAIMQAYADAMKTNTSTALTLERVSLLVGQPGGNGSVDSSLAPIAMTNAGAAAPVAMALIARKTTNLLGRSGRGRMFLPGTAFETTIDPDGSVQPTFRNQVSVAMEDFRDRLLEAPLGPITPLLLHDVTVNHQPTTIRSFVVSDLVGWVRGRIR